MSKAWESDLPTGPKMVLLALADHANDDGQCYPSIDLIIQKCSMSERSVFNQIKFLCEIGAITKFLRNGKSTVYSLHPCKFCTPANFAPLQPLQVTPATIAPPPLQPLQVTPATIAPPPLQPLQVTPATVAPRTISEPSIEPSLTSSRAKQVRGTRLQSDWQPNHANIDFCKTTRPDLQWQLVRDRFIDHWIAKTGQGATKIDWSATWRNWVRNERGKPMNTSDAKENERDRIIRDLYAHKQPQNDFQGVTVDV